jgi:hypothetical protein
MTSQVYTSWTIRHKQFVLRGMTLGLGIAAGVATYFGQSVGTELGFFTGAYFAWSFHEWWNVKLGDDAK